MLSPLDFWVKLEFSHLSPWNSLKILEIPYLNLPQNEGDVTVTSSFYHVTKHSVISWILGNWAQLARYSKFRLSNDPSKPVCGPFCSIEGGMKKTRPTETKLR